MTRPCAAVLVCPTLDLERAAWTLLTARAMAGMPCGVLLASDQEKRGAVAVNNVLLRAALDWGAAYIGYVNDDTSGFPDKWLARLVEAVASKREYGIAVAGAPCRTKPQADGRPGLPPAIIEVSHPTAWVLAVLKASMVREVGLLDESLIHYADDSDFEMRAHAAGWKSVYVQDVYVQHDTGPGHWIEDWYARDRDTFRRKWGR